MLLQALFLPSHLLMTVMIEKVSNGLSKSRNTSSTICFGFGKSID